MYRTALHWACRRGHVHAVQLLVHLGADPSIANDKDQLPNQLTALESIHDILGKKIYFSSSPFDINHKVTLNIKSLVLLY